MTEPTPSALTRRRQLVVLGSLWLVIVLVLIVFRSVVLAFGGAALIAYLVAPLVNRISQTRVGKHQVPRYVAILTIYAGFFMVVYLAAITVVPQLYREMSRVSRDLLELGSSLTPERIEAFAAEAEAWLSRRGLPVELSSRALGDPERGPLSLSFDLQRSMNELLQKGAVALQERFSDIVAVSRSIVAGVLTGVFMLFFILMLAAYMSIDSAAIGDYARSLLPSDYAEDVAVLLGRIDRSLSGVVRGQVTICVVNGILTLIGLLLLKVKFAFLLATIAMVFSLIPIFGTIISSVPIVAIALSASWKTALLALAWIIGIHALEAYALNPKIMGSAARIHPLVVAFALIAGERTFGLLGALLAVPIAAIGVACFDFARLKVIDSSLVGSGGATKPR